MKYHFQEGISDKKEGSKLKLVFLSTLGILSISYLGLLALTPVLNGWPLVSVDEAASALKSSDPGDKGDKLFIPRLNVSSPASSLVVEGSPSNGGNVTISGSSFQLGLTPEQTRQNSPFYYLDKLRSGDEIFLDFNNTRYAYRVNNKKQTDSTLTLRSTGGAVVKAEAAGTVAREGGLEARTDLTF